ncbi:MAG: FAD-dependent monooxygenase [Dehalococcoidia bacterium]|nr:FAD-dependent monooxygenase [Dehalococcoidia bacterium]
MTGPGERFDVAVVGAGPAGSAAAIGLARRGRRVVLLDRARFPRRKACGEGLFPGGTRALRALGLSDADLEPAVPLESLRFTAGPATVEAPLPAGGLGVRRDWLDAALVDRAHAAGADVRTGVVVRGLLRDRGRLTGVATDAGPLFARAVVAADGLHSPLRRKAGLDGRRPGDRYGVSAHVRLPGRLAPRIDVFFDAGFELYLTPVGEDVANVALLMRRPMMAGFAGDLSGHFAATLRAHPRLASGCEVLDQPRAAGPFPRGCTRAWRQNLMLVGDAAGFFDGISGEGMSAALLGAATGAHALDRWLDDGDHAHLRRYDAERRTLVGNANLLARLSLALARRPGLARRTVANLASRPETFARLVAISAGEAPLHAFGPRDVVALVAGR